MTQVLEAAETVAAEGKKVVSKAIEKSAETAGKLDWKQVGKYALAAVVVGTILYLYLEEQKKQQAARPARLPANNAGSGTAAAFQPIPMSLVEDAPHFGPVQ